MPTATTYEGYLLESEMQLVKYEAARQAIIEASTVDEVKTIRDKAEALRAYAKQSKDFELANKAAEIRIRAERRMGEMLREQRENGLMNTGTAGQITGERDGTGGRTVQPPVNNAPTLSDIGITKSMSSRAQAIAAIPEEQFETVITRCIYNMSLYLFFVDEESAEIYGGELNKISAQCQIIHNGKVINYPREEGSGYRQIIYFPVEKMKIVAKINDTDVLRLRVLTTKAAAYKPT